MFCPKCNKKISDKIPRCPFCGTLINGDPAAGKGNALSHKLKKPAVNTAEQNPEIDKTSQPADNQAENKQVQTAPVQPKNNTGVEEKAVTVASDQSPAAVTEPEEEIREPIISMQPVATAVHFSEEDDEPEAHDISVQKQPQKQTKKPVPISVPAPDVSMNEEERGYISDEEAEAGDGKNEGNADGGEYDYNYDGYYDDVLPVIAKEINKLPVENVLRIVFTIVAIVGIAAILVFLI